MAVEVGIMILLLFAVAFLAMTEFLMMTTREGDDD
jgi:hypothetical protein